MKRATIIILSAALLAFAVVAAHATDKGPVDGSQPAMNSKQAEIRENDNREKLRRRIEMMMTIEIADKLDLPAEKEDEFLLAMRRQFRERSDLTQEMVRTRQELENIQKTTKAKEQLEQKLAKLTEIKKKQIEIDDRFNKKLEKILTLEQRAKFIVEWPSVQEKTRAFIEQRRRKMHQNTKNKGPKAKGPKGPGGDKSPPKTPKMPQK